MHPDHGGVSPRAPLLQGLVNVRRNVHVTDAAAVGDLLVIHHPLGHRIVDGVGAGFPLHVPGVVPQGMVLPAIADVKLSYSGGVHLDLLLDALALLRLLGLDGEGDEAEERQ